MEPFFEALGGLFKVLGWLIGAFLIGSLVVAGLYILVYSVFFAVAC
jgi:hypothetical protein